MKMEQIYNPSHYGGPDDPMEAIKVLETWLSPDEMIGFCTGNAIRYLRRHRLRGGTTDIGKASWYLQYLTNYLDARGVETSTLRKLPAAADAPLSPASISISTPVPVQTGRDAVAAAIRDPE
jgi:hypothetical protein